jgi:ferritin-like protein
MKEEHNYLKRLAFYTIAEDKISKDSYFKLTGSKYEDIDCIVKVNDVDKEKHIAALDCYVTYKEVIEKTKIKEHVSGEFAFEIFQEEFSPPLSDLFEKLKG